MRLAEEAAMLDHLSRGRFDFGAGLGTHEHEFMRWTPPLKSVGRWVTSRWRSS
jgi:alkanesulfonate monooxygenase SsuD/methylene tetrahydromethanopterin reductase-like flavin-dependent oxidoreductase (luciferase family)